MAISQDHTDFTAFVNGVLAQERADGTWEAIYNSRPPSLYRAAAGPARADLQGGRVTDADPRRRRPPHRRAAGDSSSASSRTSSNSTTT